MPRVQANGIELEYDERGTGEPLVLIMGIGAQLVHWADGFLDVLVGRGFRVIRFDNRDVGLSTKIQARVPPFGRSLARRLVGAPVQSPYTLFDMAGDVTGLLDALGLERAHIAGISMGGMIAQTLAIAHPRRVASLTSIMSSPGKIRYSLAKPNALRVLLSAPPRSRDEAIERGVTFFRTCGGTTHPPDLDRIRKTSERAYDRCFHPPGFARQFAAILASGDRTRLLGTIRAPTVVVHGSVDPLILPAAGRATARAIPGARLRIVDGMGHDLPASTWNLVGDEIAAVAARA